MGEKMATIDDDAGNRYITLCFWFNMIGILIASTIFSIAAIANHKKDGS